MPGRLLAFFVSAALLLAPLAAEARAGGGASMGSRGARTFSIPAPTPTAPYSAAPMQRSMSQPVTPARPIYGGAPAYRSPFATGLLGGLIGAGIGGLLFGHGLFGGIDGLGSLFGLLLQIALVVLLLRWLFRRFTGPQPAFAGLGMARGAASPARMAPAGGAPPVTVTAADYQAFERTLLAIQDSWSRQDMTGLQRLVTPEMLTYFADQLNTLASRGQRNVTSDVRLVKGDLSEAWREGATEYATVAMRFTLIDMTLDSAGHIVDGSPTDHVTVQEMWTFLRARGGAWLLSAIQQAR